MQTRGCDPVSKYFRQRLAEAIKRECDRTASFCWETRRIADIGCGHGYWLENFIRLGADPKHVFGIDWSKARLDNAQRVSMRGNVVLGDVRQLPFPSGVFDVVSQFTVFTSVLSNKDKEQIAAEMLRTVKRRGLILWYDFFAPNPLNPKTRPIRRPEIRSLFPGCFVSLRRVTLAPPIARLALRISEASARFLDLFPFLRTHYLAFIYPGGERKSA